MKKHIDTMALLGLYTFFYLVLELAINDYAEPLVGGANVAALYGLGYLVIAAGYPLYYLSHRYLPGISSQRALMIFAAALGAAAFLFLTFTTSPGGFIACALLSHLTSGYIGGAVYYCAAMRLKDSGRIGLTVGIAYAGANGVQALGLIFLYFLSIPAGRWVERAALVLALALVAGLLTARIPLGRHGAGPPAEPLPERARATIHRYILGGLAAMALIALMHGINDGIITTLHAGGGEYIAYGYPRLFAIPGLLAAGAVADVKDRRFFPYATLLAMIIMTAAVLLFSAPATYNIATSFIYFFGSFMSLFSVVLFVEWAPSTPRPALTAAAGRSARYACSGLAIMVGGTLFASASIAVLLIVYVLFLALLFTVFFFMGQLRLPARSQGEAPNTYGAFIRAHSLTEREAEILGLLADGLSTAEMAKQLFISDKTVRNHISNILVKTQLSSRTELLLLARQAKWEQEHE